MQIQRNVTEAGPARQKTDVNGSRRMEARAEANDTPWAQRRPATNGSHFWRSVVATANIKNSGRLETPQEKSGADNRSF